MLECHHENETAAKISTYAVTMQFFVCVLSEQQRVVAEEDAGRESCLEDAVQVLVSKFHFVDLAGSERVNRTRNYGERFKGTVGGA